MRFAFELCLTQGIPHPRLLFERITWQEFVEWRAFWDAEPWGQNREDQRNAVLISCIARMLGGSTQSPSLMYPYFEKLDGVDVEASLSWLETYKAREYGKNNQQAEHPRRVKLAGNEGRGIGSGSEPIGLCD